MKPHNMQRLVNNYLSTGPSPLYTVLQSKFVTTPGALVQGNHVAPNPWNYTIDDYIGPHGQIVLSNGTYMYPEIGIYEPDVGKLYATFDDSGMYNTALSRLNGKVRGGLDLSVSAAEAGKTREMVRALRGMEEKILRTPVKSFADKFLEVKYGWQPLMQDAFGAANELLNQKLREVHRLHTVVRKQVSISPPSGLRVAYAALNPTWQGLWFPGAFEGKGMHLTKMQIELKASGFDVSRWASLNPVSLAYELTPLSFVLDWFWNVGGYLRNFETGLLYRSDFVSGFITHLRVWDSSWTFSNGVKPPGSETVLRSATPARVRWRRMTRQVLSSYPLPNFPRLQFDMKAQNWLTLAALATQRLAGPLGQAWKHRHRITN